MEQNIIDLRKIGINESVFGFASPGCGITEQNKNEHGIGDLIEEKKLLYVRSGISIRREGWLYATLSFVDRYVHSKLLFQYLNKRNIIMDQKNLGGYVPPSVTIFSYTRMSQIKYLIANMSDSSIVILMLHSILREGDEGYGHDRFYWDEDLFDSLCAWLKAQDDIQIVMTKDLLING